MRNLIILVFLFTSIIFPQQITISGKVVDASTGKPLPGANVILQNNQNIGTATNINGIFKLTGTIQVGSILKFSYVGYQDNLLSITKANLTKDLVVNLFPKIIPSQTVLVEGSLGKEGYTPLTFTKIKREQIENNYTVQDVPKYLSSLPSTTFYSENGNGIGYNYLSIRGFDQRRISVSVNGIPQNDPEDHNVYWLDFPDILGSTQIIQVQRGAGSGVFGFPAIGGSINIITSTFSDKASADFSAELGSYNVRKYSASVSSGLINKKYSFYTKLSQILSSGYRNLSWVKFNSYYFSAVRYDNNLTTQINLYGGPIEDGLAYTGLPKFAIKNKNLRKGNYSYWEADENNYTYTTPRRPTENEDYSQPHFELLNEYKFNDNVTLNSALFLVLGSGFFDYDGSWADTTYLRLTSANGFHPNQNPGNVLIRAQVDNKQFGWIPRLSIKHKNGELILGAEFRKHRSLHWGSVNYGEDLPVGITKDYRYYQFNGGKDILSGFVHDTYQLDEHWNLLGELQLSYHKYLIYDEKYLHNDFSVTGYYLNPRFGVNYKFNNEQNVYFSFARVTKEPRLTNYYDAAESSGGAVPQFQQNVGGSYNFDEPYVKPETMNDFEFGSSLITKDVNITLNMFYMLFDNEIVKNGKVDRFGQPITGNVNSTVHQGIELTGTFNLLDHLQLYATATYSKNKINEGKFFINSNNFIDLSGNRISGFPDFLTNIGITYNNQNIYVQLTGKYVGAFYSDNYDKNLSDYLTKYPGFVSYYDNKNDAYFDSDFSLSYNFNLFNALSSSKLIFQVNNIFDNLYSANAIGGEFFPAAERNFLIGLKLGL